MTSLLTSIGYLFKYPETFYMICFTIGARLISSAIMGYFTARLAKEKGYNFKLWFVVGFICDIPALIYMAVVCKKIDCNNITEKECPDCKELIKEKATKCRYCGHEFN